MISYLAVTLLVLITVDLLALVYLTQASLQERKQTLTDHAQVVAGVSARYMMKGHQYLEYIAQDYGREVDSRVMILDSAGTVLQDSFYEREVIGASLAARPEVAAALAGRTAVEMESVDGVGRTLYAAAPVLDQGTVAGAVLVAHEVESIWTSLEPVRRVLLMVSGAALLVAAAVGVILANSLARPVTMLTAGVRAVEAGDLSRQVPVVGRDELARLAEAFNGMTARLARVEQSRRAFVADAAHELRTPLAALKALVEPLLSGAVPDRAEQAEFLREIGREVDRLAALADDLLTLSQLEGGHPLERSPVDLTSLLEGVRARLLPLARESGVELRLASPAGLTAPADRLKLERAVYNLAHNAITYGHSGGVVDLAAEPAPGGVRITVADRGPGIPPEELPRLFERFHRLERSRSRQRGGAGLGLAITREIIQGHGGQIAVESRPGEGTRFVVQIPA